MQKNKLDCPGFFESFVVKLLLSMLRVATVQKIKKGLKWAKKGIKTSGLPEGQKWLGQRPKLSVGGKSKSNYI